MLLRRANRSQVQRACCATVNIVYWTVFVGDYVLCRATSSSGSVTLHATPICIVDSLAVGVHVTRNDVPADVDRSLPEWLQFDAVPDVVGEAVGVAATEDNDATADDEWPKIRMNQ